MKKMKSAVAIMLAMFMLFPTLAVTAMAAPSQWAVESVESIKHQNVVPQDMLEDYQKPIRRDEFTVIMVNVVEGIYGSINSESTEFQDIADNKYKANIEKGYWLEIINGVSPTQFNPQGTLTREQASTILCNLIALVEQPFVVTNASSSYSDADSISSWARPSVSYVSQNGIMSGVSNNKFEPQGTLTREQAYIIVDRTIKERGWKIGTQQATENQSLEDTLIQMFGEEQYKEMRPEQSSEQQSQEPPEQEEEAQWVSFNGKTITIGDTQESVEAQIGEPDRQGASQFNFTWNIYTSDPTRLIMIGYIDGKVAGIYNMSQDFTSSYGNYGDTIATGHLWFNRVESRRLRDSLNDNKVYAVMLLCNKTTLNYPTDSSDSRFNDFAKNQLETINVLRNWEGIATMQWDDSLAEVARLHSKDMADRNYYDHHTPEGVRIIDRIRAGTRFEHGSENIHRYRSVNSLNEGFSGVNNYLNSAGHRVQLINPQFEYFGTGYYIDSSGQIRNTQNFAY